MNIIAWQWSWPNTGAELQVGQQAFHIFDQYRQSEGENERGGQLFIDPAHPGGLLLCNASPPHPADRSGRTWLELDSDRCRIEIEKANTEGLRLVGYWHTHPQCIPQISGTDIASFVRFAKQYAHELPHPIAVIVGKSSTVRGIKAWIFRDDRCHEAIHIAPPIRITKPDS